jgi:hypothetical protein
MENLEKMKEKFFMSKVINKFSFSVKTIAADESLHIFAQMNQNFSETLNRVEKESSVLKPLKRTIQVEVKNTGIKMRVYE